MPQTIRHRVFITAPSPHGGSGDIPALLDMLRYEAGVVARWDAAKDARDRDGWTVDIDTAHPAPDRWASFGIRSERVA